jgi:hypothetical protein
MSWKLDFLPNPSDQSEGIDDNYVATFRGAPYSSTAKECGQNTADASLDNSDPVELQFDLIQIPADDLPCLDSYKEIISLCLKKAKTDFKDDPDEKTISIFSQADKAINQKTIQVLRIADYNTTGLTGPSEEGTPFHSLLKGSGVSNKTSNDTGSYGIGKNAVFSISEMQTVFYSTIYKDLKTGNKLFLAQAKSLLTSHIDNQKQSRRSIGYNGASGYKPITDINCVPDWLKRSEPGASIFAIAFRSSKDWVYRMAASLLFNFFCALWDKKFIFKLNGELEICNKNVVDLFENPKIIEAAKSANKEDDFEFSRNLLECLISDETIEKQISIDDLGNFSIRILLRENFPKRIAIVRNGMMITDNLKHFNDRFSRFPNYKDFVALVQPDKEAGAILRKLEDPNHNEFSAERITNEKKQKKIETAMKKLAKQIRAAIREVAVPEPEDETDLDELSEFFADADDSQKLPDPEGETDPERQKYSPPKKRKKQPPEPKIIEIIGKEGGAGGNGEGSGNGGGEGPDEGRGSGGTGSRSYAIPTRLKEIRNLIPGDDAHKRRVIFTPEETCKATIRILASGLAVNDDLSVTASQEGEVENGGLIIDLNKREKVLLDIEFKEDYPGPIEIQALKNIEGVLE